MKLLWTFLKVIVALALVVPISIIVLATALGIFGALVGLAILALRLAIVGLIAYGVFRLATALFGGSRRRSTPPAPTPRAIQPVDPHYEAAMRELDRELGHTR